MKYISENASKELAALFHSIGKDAESWDGWSCLHIETVTPARNYDRKALHREICAILDRYFLDGGGMTFFIEETDIYVFCKDAVTALMNDAGNQIAGHIAQKTGSITHNAHWPIQSDAPPPVESTHQKNFSFTRVLLVEDDPVTRWMVRTALKGQCILLTSATAGGAIESYHKCKPDLVFLDINLPDKSGQEVLKDIFNDDPRANIVVFSSQNNIETMIEMLEAGACGFVSKPFTRQRLLTYVKRLSD